MVHNWFYHLTQGLLQEGFKQSMVDPCLFLKSNCILIIYTDDRIIFSQKDATIDALLCNLSQNFLLEDQGSAFMIILRSASLKTLQTRAYL
jgi:hypothetical protein